MKLSQSSSTLLEKALQEAIAPYNCGNVPTVVTDIHLQPNPNSGELSIFDDEDKVLATTTIKEWTAYEGNNFYEQAERILSAQLSTMKNAGDFDKLNILKPFSFVLVEDRKSVV